jgi:hypothetical protein
VSSADRIRSRLDSIARARWFRVSVAALFTLVILAITALVYPTASRLHSLGERVPRVLSELNLNEKDPLALTLTEKGTIVVDRITLGNEAFAPVFARAFNTEGRLERIGDLAALLVNPERPDWLPRMLERQPELLLGGAAIAIAVVNFACFSGLALSLVGVVLASTLLFAVGALFDRPDLAASLAAIPGILFAFALLIRLLLLGLDGATPLFAVACGVVREAMRLRVAVVFAGVALIVIPLLPQWLDPSSPLRYQVQTFLSRSLDTMYLVCAFLTIFFGCATVAFEIRDRQSWMTLTKPVSRISWLAGKWLGLVVLNAAILTVATLTMVGFLAQVSARPALDVYDFNAVRDEVLVARAGGTPIYSGMTSEEMQTAVMNAMRADPNLQADLREGVRTELEVQKMLARQIAEQHLGMQRSIPPQAEKTYRFEGLGQARDAGAYLTLRYKFYSGSSDPHALYPVIFRYGEEDDARWVDRQFVAAQSNALIIPPEVIAPDGSLVLRIANLRFNPNAAPGAPAFEPGTSTIIFDPDGLELLYKVGDFGPNLVRAQLVNLMKLSFIAMLAVTLSSFLNFPVACLVVFTVFAAGSLAPYLATTIDMFRIRNQSGFAQWFEAIVRGIASATEFTVRAFGEARASGPVVEGRVVSEGVVLRTLGLIGIAWSGIVLLVGFGIFRRKELAIYSGQGG